MPTRKGKEEPKKPERRPKGEGSVYQRRDGRWVAAVMDPLTNKKKELYAHTEEEAWERRAEFLRGGQPLPPSDMTVADLIEEYLSVREVNAPPHTLSRLNHVLHKQVLPRMGGMKVADVTPRHVQEVLVNPWVKIAKYAPSTVHTYYLTVGGLFTYAVKHGITELTPCRNVTLPTVARPKREVFSPEQVKQLLEAIPASSWFRTFLIVALATGMRKGELLALKWGDVDLVKGRLTVVRSLSDIGEYIEGEPKSRSSRRVIVLQAQATAALKLHRLRQGEQKLKAETWEEHDLVFSGPRGHYFSHYTPNRALAAALARAGLSLPMTVHGTRHTLASQLLGHRVNPKVVQEILGHANVETTLGIYGHCLPLEHEEAMETAEQVMWG